MVDIFKEESSNALRLSWNVFPSNKIDMQRYVVPLGFHYSPMKPTENLQILEYDPILCKTCKSVVNPYNHIDFRSKTWECPFCLEKHLFPSNYSAHISESNLPAELVADYSTIEYKLNRKESNWPVFLFLIDTAVEVEELQELKESIQNTMAGLPSECGIGIITFGTMCNVVELGFSEFPKMFVFNGAKDYKPNEIQEQLGFWNNPGSLSNKSNTSNRKFILPLKDCEFTVNSFLDDLTSDLFEKQTGERKANCGGLALHVAITLLESICAGEPSRICIFLGGASNIGPGKTVGLKLAETIRNYVDFEKGNSNTNYFKPAVEFYQNLASRAYKAGQTIDVFSCCLNQVGLLEMKCLVEKTGGYLILTDSFSTILFKDSFKKIFDLDEEGSLKMAFRGKLDLFVTSPVKISGAAGHLVSLKQVSNTGKNNMISDLEIAEGKTRSWNLGGMDQNSTYTFFLDVENSTNPSTRRAIIQILTTYVAGDRSTRLRVTTILRKICPDLNNAKYEVAQSFDQEAAAVLIARLCIEKGYKEDSIEVLRWLDKSLIRLISKFADYNKDDPRSFKLSKEFSYFPQFMFYLRRSHFLQNFNASPDEITFYKTSLLHENVTNSTIMIQPVLFVYCPERPDANAVFLDIENMKNDYVLLLDAYFFICIWHGEAVCKWRDDGVHLDPDYENIKMMLEYPQEYAQSLLIERMPVPRFVSCDYGSGQERLIKCTVNPGGSTPSEGSSLNSKIIEEGSYVSDDVSLKVFMDHLIKKAVTN